MRFSFIGLLCLTCCGGATERATLLDGSHAKLGETTGASRATSTCGEGDSISYRRPLPGASEGEESVQLLCKDGGVQVWVMRDTPYMGPDGGVEFAEVSVDEGTLEVAAFERLWLALVNGARVGRCHVPKSRSHLVLQGNGTMLNCDPSERNFTPIVSDLEAILREFREIGAQFDWSFEGDYWKDELSHYRNAAR